MEHRELFPHVNDSIRRLASEGPPTETWEFICECPDVTCHALVTLTLVEFDERREAASPEPILATEHDEEGLAEGCSSSAQPSFRQTA